MIGSLQSALSGLVANQRRVDVAAQNIANAETKGYGKQVLRLEEGPAGGVVARSERADTFSPSSGPGPSAEVVGGPTVDLTEEIPALTLSKGLYKANLAVVRTQDEMLGSLLNRRD